MNHTINPLSVITDSRCSVFMSVRQPLLATTTSGKWSIVVGPLEPQSMFVVWKAINEAQKPALSGEKILDTIRHVYFTALPCSDLPSLGSVSEHILGRQWTYRKTR